LRVLAGLSAVREFRRPPFDHCILVFIAFIVVVVDEVIRRENG
jgi:hypothetical protein